MNSLTEYKRNQATYTAKRLLARKQERKIEQTEGRLAKARREAEKAQAEVERLERTLVSERERLTELEEEARAARQAMSH